MYTPWEARASMHTPWEVYIASMHTPWEARASMHTQLEHKKIQTESCEAENIENYFELTSNQTLSPEPP